MTMNFDELSEFKRIQAAPKNTCHSWKIWMNSKILSAIPLGNSKHFNVIKRSSGAMIVKARLFGKYLKGSSLRVIYSYIQQTNTIEFIELYFKRQ